MKFLHKIFGKKIHRSKKNIEGCEHFFCPICKSPIKQFNQLPEDYLKQFDHYGLVHSIFCFETFNVLGYTCPICHSSDRNRLYAIYFRELFKKLDSPNTFSFLDIAPDKHLSKLITTYSSVDYRSADLFMENVTDKIDIRNMDIYNTNFFDFVLCSHVLEHIDEDKKAMSEIYRILKPGGHALIMVPILLSLQEDLENPAWTSDAERWKYYAQDDHVRLYSKGGFIKKLEQTGFKVSQFGIDFFGTDEFEKHGIHPRSILYIVEKIVNG